MLNALWLATGRRVYFSLFQYWKKIFAIAFGMGVVSGLVMSYQFGTNWSVFSDNTGPVLGPMMGYEVLSAFFLEAGFLGIMLFGLKRVGPKLHFLATLMVAFGTFMSAFWILSVNSWMQTPAGYAVNAAGQFVVVDWFAVIFNPSFPYRLVHMLLAAYLTTAFVVGATGAYQMLKGERNPGSKTMFSMAMWMAATVAPIQFIAGDFHGLNTLHHQPAKIAAMEGHFDTHPSAPLILFGIPNTAEERIDYKVEIPTLGSLILTHEVNGQVKGLKEWPVAERPPVSILFWSFRIMVALGVGMMLVGFWSLYARWRQRLFVDRGLHRVTLLMGPSGFMAVLAGWITTEVGRQPYTVYGLLTTAQSASSVAAPAIGASLIAFIVVYFGLFGAGTFYIVRLMRKAPVREEPDLPHDEPIRASGITPAPTLDVPSVVS